jgi:HPt (histidine-containing phosphotransfer) domain-containing protein
MTEFLDRGVLAELSESVGAEFVVELIDTFVEESPGLFEELHQALSRSDADLFRRAAHSLKTNAMTFGAIHLAELARELESRAREKNLPADGGLDALNDAYQVATNELSDYKKALVTKGNIL